MKSKGFSDYYAISIDMSKGLTRYNIQIAQCRELQNPESIRMCDRLIRAKNPVSTQILSTSG